MFEIFCNEYKIDKNYKEAFYHHLMAEYSEYENPAAVIDELSKAEYLRQWRKLLSGYFAKVME